MRDRSDKSCFSGGEHRKLIEREENERPPDIQHRDVRIDTFRFPVRSCRYS